MKTPGNMQQLETLFHQALELRGRERNAFIEGLRKSNPELVSEVESLISAHEGTDDLIDAPAYEVAAELIAEQSPALATGQVIGHYKILGPIGKGGMGEVYLASDEKLDRKVALKLLPSAFTKSSERLLRFIQEAKAASSLNHPNIITIHEIGEAEGVHFIATEFIDGHTLRQHLAQARMKLLDVLDVSIQAASALQAAHAAGIVHRDIKPENIMLRPDGYVKILDFGLAKLTEKTSQTGSAEASSEIDTIVKARTKPGTLMGTFRYMSPEQARGQVLDARSDIFSFGIVMYEMTAGRVAFNGATEVDALVEVLEKEPPPLDEDVPAELQRIIGKSLRKERGERYQTIKDLLIDLRGLKEELIFKQRLGNSRTTGSTDPNLKPQTQIRSGVAQSLLPNSKGAFRKTLVPVVLVLLVLAAVIAGLKMWPRKEETPVVSPPLPTAERSVSYWITVQKYRDGKPFQEPFRLRDDINFEKDYRIRLTLTSAQSGHLYLLNEGPTSTTDTPPTFNVLFPSETTNDGSALLKEKQQIQIPEQSWFQFDEQQGTEKIWLVWAEKEVPEMEAVKGFANEKDRGVVSSPGLRTAVDQFLKGQTSSQPIVERNADTKETVVRSQSAILVHSINLEHN
jgi:serine/threonine protein kinase